MSTTAIDLKPFCGPVFRYDTAAPWRAGDWLYASDCCIAVRVPAPAGSLELAGKYPPMDKLKNDPWGQFPLTDTVPLPEVPLPPLAKCKPCNGAGKVYECPECDGSGEVTWTGDYSHHDYSDECRLCDGEGKQAGYPTGEESACPHCDGRGKVETGDNDLLRVPVGGVEIAVKYHRLIAALGEVQVKAHDEYLLFQTGELQGLVMRLGPKE